jgi:hypothetical protein
VCSSAFEAEYARTYRFIVDYAPSRPDFNLYWFSVLLCAGLFSAARIATDERTILVNMGHPQPPTTVFCDNECAIGIANRTVTPKISKTVDMRFNWVQDRVKQKQFCCTHVRGLLHLGDFFTKSLPVAAPSLVIVLSHHACTIYS